jgi:hypothetical protein
MEIVPKTSVKGYSSDAGSDQDCKLLILGKLLKIMHQDALAGNF